MRMTQTNRPQSSSERRAETELSADRELAETGRDKPKRNGIHPSLRALPDYPAR